MSASKIAFLTLPLITAESAPAVWITTLIWGRNRFKLALLKE